MLCKLLASERLMRFELSITCWRPSNMHLGTLANVYLLATFELVTLSETADIVLVK